MNNIDRFKIIPAAYLLFEKNGKVLLMSRFNTGYRDGEYTLPAGHIEENEFPMDTGVREGLEEVGLKFEKKDLEFINVLYNLKEDNSVERVDFFFKVLNWEGNAQNLEPQKCDDLGWFDINNLPENTLEKVKICIDLYLKNKHYAERDLIND